MICGHIGPRVVGGRAHVMGGLLHTRRFAARGFRLRTSGYSTSAVPLVTALALVLTTAPFLPAAVAAPEPACTPAEKTVVAAAAMAKRCGTKVEISPLRSETDQTFARPTGGYTTEQSVEPRWAKKPDGTWTPIDTTLRADANGVVTPVASALPVVFSGGGTGPVAVLREGDHELALTWPGGSLPKPTLSGPHATYAEVFPGVDLRFTASPQGFSQLLVVKTRQAASHPGLAEVKFGLSTKGVQATANGTGGLVAKDPAGKVVFESPVPVMWDSSPDMIPVSSKVPAQSKSTTEPMATTDPADNLRRVTMPVKVGGGELSVTPSAAMMTDPTTKFPVYIDPSWTGHIQDNAWTMVMGRSDLTNTSFWQNGAVLSDWDVRGGAGVGRVCDLSASDGACQSPQYLVRSFFRMDLEEMIGKVITGASFRLQQQWSWTCNATDNNARVWITYPIDSNTTWNNQPGFWEGDYTTAIADHRVDSRFGCQGTGDVEFDVSAIVKKAVNGSWPAVTLGMRAIDETTVNQWKRYNPTTPVLAIDYNTPPNVPDELTVDGKECATDANRPFTPTATPTLRARFSDDDAGDTMETRFEWSRVREDGTYAPIAETRELGGRANDAISETTLPSPTGLPFGVLDGSDAIIGAADWDGDGRSDVLSEDVNGYQYLFPGDATKLGARVLLGAGWNPYTIAGVADWDKDGKADVIARHDPTGQLYVYPGENKRGPSSQTRGLIGTGFGAYTFAGVADWDKDGKTDLIARDDNNGTLYLFPGENKRTASSQAKVSLGTGWGNRDMYGVIDRTGDGAPDVIAQINNDGKLWLYPGSGARSPYTGTPVRHQIGAGFSDATIFPSPDFNGGGATDLIAQLPDTNTWQLYPGVVGTGSGGVPQPIAGFGVAEGAYAFRATAGDGRLWSEPSDWCEFSVDLVAPDAPTVTAQTYKPAGCPTEGCGSLGVADTFTFASTSTDVVKYRWGFTDPPAMTVTAPTMGAAASVVWTPPSSGPKTLYVDAVDRAGLTKRTAYQFGVASPTNHSGRWLFGDVPETDSSTAGRDLTLVGVTPGLPGRTRGGQPAVGFNGTSSNTATTVKVLDTSRSFSVSAWVRLAGDTADRAVISQQGATTAAFRLGYQASQHKWTFSLAESDVSNAVQRQVFSDATAKAGVWTHLTGTYESSNREVRLYVDGVLQRETGSVGNGFDATGGLWIGRRLFNGAAVEPWQGDMEDVRVWGRALTAPETAALVDPMSVSRVGWWQFNEASGKTAYDASRYAHDLTLTLGPGASWGSGRDGTGLHLDGTGSAQSSESVLNTDQTFSVDVWARLSDQGAPRTIVVQRGPSGVDPFALKYDGAKWTAEMPNSSASPTMWWRAKSTANASVNTWTHLAVAYDASTRTLSLWVNDVLQSTVTGVVGWNHDGLLTVGSGSGGAYWLGDIDELTVFQGLLTAKPLSTSAPLGSSMSGDAKAEIISVDADGVVRAFLNTDGAYASGSQDIGSGWTAARTWFADLNADGRTEIIGMDADGTIRAFPNINGMNGFPFGAGVVVGKATSTDASRLRFADFDGDGRADRVSLDSDGRVRVYRNLYGINGSGQSSAFSAAPVIAKVTSLAPDKIRFADIDGDHRAEFITVNSDGIVWAYRNLSGLDYGMYDGYQEIGMGWTSDRTWFADIDGNGRAEIVTVHPDETVWSFPNVNGLNGFPFGDGVQIGSGWAEPARIFFS